MKKITIKHYLNKRLQPSIIYDGITAYPLYLQIIAQRRTQQIKSFTAAYMSEKAFEILQSGGNRSKYMEETNQTEWVGIYLEDEPIILEAAIRYLIENNIKYSLKSEQFREFVENYTIRAGRVFGRAAGQIDVGERETDEYILSFDRQSRTMIENRNAIMKLSDIDILKCLPTDYVKIWQVVELIKTIDKGRMFVSIGNDDLLNELLEIPSTNTKVRDIYELSDLQKEDIVNVLGMLSKRIKHEIANLFS
jgi:hypothetical protein